MGRFRVRNPGSIPLHIWEIYWKVLKEGWTVVEAVRESPFDFYYLEIRSPQGDRDVYLLDGRS